MSAEQSSLGGEICPYIVYCMPDEGGMQCAIWQLEDGRQTLALFLDEATATQYIADTKLGDQWQPHCPGRDDLLEIIRQSTAAGISLAALDPSDQSAKRLFDLDEVVKKAAAS